MSIESRSNQYGTVFEHWQIQELLGQGSGGKTAVFRLARTDAARMQSALKVVNLIEERGEYTKKSDWQQREYDAALQDCKNSASQEVLLMNDFQGNTNIVDYLDHKFINWTDKLGFGCDMLIRMELLTDLRSQIQNGVSFSEAEIIKIGCDICRALVLCHSRDILHRDIKPENIFVNRNGDYKLGDFGISRIIGSSPMSVASTGIGTREYAAPEQFSGKYDRRVDIYSLGLVLYELSNRFRLPFASSSYIRPEDVTKRVMGTPLQTPASASQNFSAVILKACAYKPDERYQTAKEFMDALIALASTVQVAPQKQESKVASASIEAAGYSTLPAVPAEATTKKPPNTPVRDNQKNSYSTMPAVGDKNVMASESYQTIPAKPAAVSVPTPPSKKQKNTYQVPTTVSSDDFLIRKETIRKPFSGKGKVKTDDEYAVVDILVEPYSEPGLKFDFQATTDVIPGEYYPFIVKGILRATETGPLSGCPVDGIRVAITGGAYHPVFSSHSAFEEAAYTAFSGSYFSGAPTVLEAFLEIKADIMDDEAPNVLSEISLHRGRVMDLEIVSDLEAGYSRFAFEIPAVAKEEITALICENARGKVLTVQFAHYEQAIVPRQDKAEALGDRADSSNVSSIPHFGKVVKQKASVDITTEDTSEVRYGTLVTDYRQMIDDETAEYPNPTYATDPKGRQRLFNHLTWITYKSVEYEIVAQHTGSDSCMFFIFVVKNEKKAEPHFVDDERRANAVFDLFKQQCDQSTSFAGGKYSYAKAEPVEEPVRIPAMLCRDYKQMSDKVFVSYEKPITLQGPDHRSYAFDHITTITMNGVEYYLVAQVDSHGNAKIFVFKNPPGTANPPVFLYEGKTMRRVYHAFQNQFDAKYYFEDRLEYGPSIPAKVKSGVRHFAQSTAANRFKDGLPDVVSIEGKYHVIDSYAFKKVIKGTVLVKELIIPKTIQKIEDHAFAGIVVDSKVTIPKSVSFIGKDAFTLSGKGYVDCEKSSYAYRYCAERGIPNSVDIIERKSKSVCVHCGSAFKGLFIKRCSNPNCGKTKDY